MNKRSVPLSLIALIGLAGPWANAENTLRVGIQAGIGQWEEDVGAQLVDVGTSLKADAEATIGIVGQYLMGVGADADEGYFVGFEVGAAQENFSEKDAVEVEFFGSPFAVAVEGDLKWSVDLLWLAGYDFGRVSAFLAGGASYVGGDFSASVADIAESDSATHLGWKVGPGVEIDLGKSSTLLVRANYGVYQGKTYSAPVSGRSVGVSVEPKVFDVRVAWTYHFNPRDIFGPLR